LKPVFQNDCLTRHAQSWLLRLKVSILVCLTQERKYVERQKEDAIRNLQTLSIEHRKKLEPVERDFLTQKHSVSKGCN